jgi:hypothetical protein
MSYTNCKSFKQQKLEETLSKISSHGHVLKSGDYCNQQSLLIVFCAKHNTTHKTTFINYTRSKNGMPCCSNKKKSEKLKHRVFSLATIEQMRKSATTRAKKVDISYKNKKYWRRTVNYRNWTKNVTQNWNNECAITGEKQNLLCHHFYSYNKAYCSIQQKFLRYHLQNGILICEDVHVLFHLIFGYTNTTLNDFLAFLTYLLYYATPISSQAYQEWWEGSETRVHDPERIMRLHERLEKIQNTVFFMI